MSEGHFPAPSSSPAAPSPASTPSAPASVNPSGFAGSHVSFGLADGLIRVARGGEWLLLANPRFMASDDDEQLYGLGFIFRRRPGEGIRQSLFLRFDVRNTPGDNWYTTTSGGFEHRGALWTGRLRGFISPHGADVVERRIEEEEVRRPDGSTDTIRRTFERLEIPLTGAEAEGGLRIPLPPFLGDLRIFGGAHYRDGPSFDAQSGWLTRTEYRPRERFSFEFAAYFNRDFTEVEYLFGVRAIFPFGTGGGGNGKSMGGEHFWFEPPPFNPRAVSGKSASARRSKEQVVGTKPPPPPPSMAPKFDGDQPSDPDLPPDTEPPDGPDLPYDPDSPDWR